MCVGGGVQQCPPSPTPCSSPLAVLQHSSLHSIASPAHRPAKVIVVTAHISPHVYMGGIYVSIVITDQYVQYFKPCGSTKKNCQFLSEGRVHGVFVNIIIISESPCKKFHKLKKFWLVIKIPLSVYLQQFCSKSYCDRPHLCTRTHS